MKKIVMSFIVVMMCIVLPVSVMAATNAQVVTAIDNGLSYLAGQQTAGGYWNYGGYEEAATGAVIGAFVSQQSLWGANAPAYQTAVNNAMSYLLANASTMSVSTNGNGNNICPGGIGSCTGVWWAGNGEATYTTGIVASAIGQYAASNPSAVATTTGPLAGMTYTQIAQGIVNEYSASQSVAGNANVAPLYGNAVGGWRYYIPGNGDSDGSTTQWAVLSMIYGQSLGATVPAVVKTNLQQWLAFDQNMSGAGCYQGPNSGICEQSDTGSLLLGLKFTGANISNPQVQAALTFLNNNWKELGNGTWFGNFGQPYAMWADYKALELWIGKNDNTTITNLLDPTQANWWADYNQWLVANQNGDGSWNGYAYWTGPLATAWDVSILGGTVIPPPTVPEPATMLLLGLGLVGLGVIRRKM